MVTVLEQAAPNVQRQCADRAIIVEKPAVSNAATNHPYSMFHFARKRSTMAPAGACLSDQEERFAITWQTSKLFPTPDEMDRLVRVVHVIERHFLSNKFDHWIADGSVYFRHKTMPGNIVRVWVDHENSLSELFSDSTLPPSPIAVGIDVTAHPVIKRQTIRQFMRDEFKHYCDPEQIIRPIVPESARKVSLKPDYNHWLDVVFLNDAPSNIPIDAKRLHAVEHAIGDGSSSWYF